MLLTLLAFADIYSRIGEIDIKCRLIKEQTNLKRVRRDSAPSPPIQTLLNASKHGEILIRSLPETKVLIKSFHFLHFDFTLRRNWRRKRKSLF